MRSKRLSAALLALLMLIALSAAGRAEAVPPDGEASAQVEPEVGLADDAGDTGLTVEYEAADGVEYGGEPADDALLSDDGAATLGEADAADGGLLIEATAILSAGYVAVAPDAPVYADAERTQALGAFSEGAAVYAEPTDADGLMLRVRFDTDQTRGWNEPVVTGYVQSADALAYTEAESEALRQALEADARTRYLDGVAIPCAAFSAAAGGPAAAVGAGLGVAPRTQEEIQAFVNAHPAYRNQVNLYQVAPTDKPYAAGKLSAVNQRSALNLVCQLRYIAGLGADLSLLTEQEDAMGATALVIRLYSDQYRAQHGSDILSHYPGRASALSDAVYDGLYAAGYVGAGRANIAMGYTVTNALLAYMSDADDVNIKTVGHRRWILNPEMGRTVFGANGRFSAMYAHDLSAGGGESRVAWPAQQMPLEYFNASDPWSLSYGRVLNADKISVTLVRVRDSRAWTFSSASADGAFFVENSGYGQRGCVIFRPSGLGQIAAGDTFNVSVTDDEAGEVTRYTVRFFSLDLSACEALETLTNVAAVRTPDGCEVSWGGVSGAQGYYVLRRAADEENFHIVADVTGDAYRDAAAPADQPCYYQVYGHTADRTSRAAIAVPARTIAPESVSLGSGATLTVYRNRTLQLTATLAPANAMAGLTWKSSRKKVATVDENGLVTPVKKGTAVISVTTDNGKQASVKVKVVDPPRAASVTLNYSGAVVLNVGESLQLTAAVAPAEADQAVTWKSNRAKIAGVSASGLVTAQKAGTATITARSASGKKARLTVRVADPYAPDSVTLSAGGTVTLKVGQTLKLDAVLAPATARTTLAWSSSGRRVAAVDAEGNVTALRRGTATITVRTANGKKARVKIRVVK